jgi:hypothetical protein
MKLLGVTQGSNLRVFLRLAELLKEPLGLDGISAYVADAQEFHSLRPKEPMLASSSLQLLKEWEIFKEGLQLKPDWDALLDWEKRLGDPVLWNALMADRRIFFGRKCKYRQDYRPRFSHLQMGGILQSALKRIEDFINWNSPDVIIGFGTSTLGDYLFYRFAKSKGIAYLQLKATKIGNYVSLNDDAVALSNHIELLIRHPENISPESIRVARAHLASIRHKGVGYEGAIKSHLRLRPISGLIAFGRAAIRDIRNRLHPEIKRDNHVESSMQIALYSNWVQPLKAAYTSLRLRGKLIRPEQLADQPRFAFYPLHFEPEVSLQVFGRPFQNQIEVVRNLAASLPCGMVVLVKEHPRALGFRPYGYYRKLLEISNVRLVSPSLPTHAVIRHSSLVAVISGSTGLEAAVMGKPVIIFGIPTYLRLSVCTVRPVRSMHELAGDVRVAMTQHQLNEAELEHFFAAHVAGSVPVDLYSVLLGKSGRHSEGRENMTLDERRGEDYQLLMGYCIERIRDAIAKLAQHAD